MRTILRQMAVVLGDRSLDDLQAPDALFTQIPNKDIGPSYPTAPVFAPGQLPARLTSQSLKDRGRLAVRSRSQTR